MATFEINLDVDCLSRFKTAPSGKISVGFDALNLGTKLYGADKKQSKAIQKANYEQIMRLYKLFKKIVRVIKRASIDFDGAIYVANLENKKNNNDFMLAALLNLKFGKNKLANVVSLACEYLDKENALNQMCDFKGNKCRKQQETNSKNTNGCCAHFCPYYKEGRACEVRCMSCKLFMCDYLEKKGYVFFIRYIPILRLYLSPYERFKKVGGLFKSEEQTIRYLKWNRFVFCSLVAFVGAVAALLLVAIILSI